MKTYIVGGAVRDELLGLPVQDRDHVVVGATPEQMRAAGYRAVGRDFPVFLHPQTQEEYALARTERKTGPGYAGFTFHASPDVTLEEDLRRRDLTINAMARDADGTLIDPYGGRRDLEQRWLRHVSEAFLEDPVRILRVARFAARFDEFEVAPETTALMRTMVANGEVDALVAERVWQELSRGLMEAHPVRMFAVLRNCGALARLLPELDALWGCGRGDDLMAMLQRSADRAHPLAVRCAVLLHALDPHEPPDAVAGVKLIESISSRLRLPTAVRDLARLAASEHVRVRAASQADARQVVDLLERCDAIRKPARFSELLRACEAIDAAAPAKGAWPPTRRLSRALQAAMGIDAGAIARQGPAESIRERIHEARVTAVAALTRDDRGDT